MHIKFIDYQEHLFALRSKALMYFNCTLGHQKLNRTYFDLIERVSNRLSLKIRNIAEDRSQEVRFGRLLRHGEICLN